MQRVLESVGFFTLWEAISIIRNEVKTTPMAMSVPLALIEEGYEYYGEKFQLTDGVKEELALESDGIKIFANRDINHVAGIAVDCTFDIMFGHKTTVLNWKMSQFPTMKFI